MSKTHRARGPGQPEPEDGAAISGALVVARVRPGGVGVAHGNLTTSRAARLT